MFDTVHMKVKDIHIPTSKLLNFMEENILKVLDSESGEIKTRYTMKDDKIPFIRYYDSSNSLVIHLSITKFLKGNNVQMITPADIPLFFEELSKRLHELIGVTIESHEWIVMDRLDVCWNFNVGNKVSEYIAALGKIEVPYRKTRVYINQSVEYVTRKERGKEMFYDKQQECIDNKENFKTIEQANGILRFEIHTTEYELRLYDKNRQAIQLISKDFFERMTKKVLKHCEVPNIENKMSLAWLSAHASKLGQVETVLGFQQLHKLFPEPTLKSIYKSSTYYCRNNLESELNIPMSIQLQPLFIDYSKIG